MQFHNYLLNNFLILLLLPPKSIFSKEYVTFISDHKWERRQYLNIDYTYLTSLVICDDNPNQSFISFVKSKNPNIKFQRLIGDNVIGKNKGDKKKWAHHSYLDYIIEKLVKSVIDQGIHGINIDIEGQYYSEEYNNGIVYFVKNLYTSLKKINTNYTVTYDVPYDPKSLACVTGRCQPWTEISKYVDFLYVMDYDAQLERIFVGECTDPIVRINAGMRHYLDDFEIPSSKLVNLIDCTGSKYKCYNNPKKSSDTCYTNTITRQKGFSMCDQYNHLRKAQSQGFKLIKNDYQNCYNILYRNETTHQMYQIWFDDLDNLKNKMEVLAVQNDLAGIGFWSAMAVESEDALDDEECYVKFIRPFYKLMQTVFLELKDGMEKRKVFEKAGFL